MPAILLIILNLVEKISQCSILFLVSTESYLIFNNSLALI